MPFDLDAVRAQFPALTLTDSGRRRIYFDNPAGTQVPQSVADAMSRCLLETNANAGGRFVTSKAADEIVEGARAAMADFLNAGTPDEIVFGQNMTSLTFAASRAIAAEWEPDARPQRNLPRFHKLVSDDLRDVVENYDEIAANPALAKFL